MNFIVNETAQKLRGGYYTPIELADFIVKWAIQKKNDRVLEPSCGDGVFITAINNVMQTNELEFTGIEYDPIEASKAKENHMKSGFRGHIESCDFLSWYLNDRSRQDKFDAVVGNPPFIRYQYLPESMQSLSAKIFTRLNIHFTKHTNAWIPFVLASIDMLRPGGRLAMIIPTEVFNVLYAQSLRTYLGETCSEITIIDPEDIWFKSTLQGAVILLAQKKIDINSITNGLGVIRTKGLDFCMKNPNAMVKNIHRINGYTIEGKWTNAFLTEKEFSVYLKAKKMARVKRFEQVASVDVGIVTGANSFFLVNDEVVKEYDLSEFAFPMFGRSEHCPGVVYSKAVHQANVLHGIPSYFIWIKPDYKIKKKKHLLYIAKGELEGLDKRYKCRIRSPWYSVPSVYSTDIGMLKRSHDLPRLILNELGAFTTDTAYRVKAISIDPKVFVYSFVNSLTALSAEIEGRSYGGGVLELVPSEINKLLIPIIDIANPDIKRLDSLAISKDPLSYLPEQDRVILGNIGISKDEQEILFNAWLKLRNRRHRKS
jgi:adenine-specific DNA-methyltransferase